MHFRREGLFVWNKFLGVREKGELLLHKFYSEVSIKCISQQIWFVKWQMHSLTPQYHGNYRFLTKNSRTHILKILGFDKEVILSLQSCILCCMYIVNYTFEERFKFKHQFMKQQKARLEIEKFVGKGDGQCQVCLNDIVQSF